MEINQKEGKIEAPCQEKDISDNPFNGFSCFGRKVRGQFSIFQRAILQKLGVIGILLWIFFIHYQQVLF